MSHAPSQTLLPMRLWWRIPAFWMWLILLTVAAVAIIREFLTPITDLPKAALLAAVLFGLHGLVFIILVRTLDYLEPEPPLLLLMALLWGGLVAIAAAGPANGAVFELLTRTFSPSFVERWAAAIAGPSTEETLKTLGIIAMVLLARRHINSVIDGVVYGAFVGLGFQEVENFSYAMNATYSSAAGDVAGPVLNIFLVRGFLAGLWSHTVYSGIAGAGIAYFVVRREKAWPVRLLVAILAFAAAWGVHFLWNSPLLNNAFNGDFGQILVFFIKGIPILVLFLLIARGAGKRERVATSAALQGLNDPAYATPGEISALVSPVKRLHSQWNSYVRGGPLAIRPTRSLQRGQARLAQSVINSVPDEPAVGQIVRARERLERRGLAEVSGEKGPRTFGGMLSILLGLTGIGVIVAIPMCWLGARKARRKGTLADFKLFTGVLIGLLVLAILVLLMAVNATDGG